MIKKKRKKKRKKKAKKNRKTRANFEKCTKSLLKKTGKAKLWRSIWLVMKKKFSASSDVIWRFKKIICQNRINKIGQIQPKCLKENMLEK